jgi:hypothetical protein
VSVDNFVTQDEQKTSSPEGDRFLARLNALADVAPHLPEEEQLRLAEYFGKWMNDSLDAMCKDDSVPTLIKGVLESIK